VLRIFAERRSSKVEPGNEKQEKEEAWKRKRRRIITSRARRQSPQRQEARKRQLLIMNEGQGGARTTIARSKATSKNPARVPANQQLWSLSVGLEPSSSHC
jgi:hypothetical protein